MAKAQPAQAIYCDGLNDFVDPNVLVNSIFNNFTFEMWVRPTTTHQIDVQSTSGTSGTSGQRYALWPTWRGTSNSGIGVSVGTNGVSVYEHGASYMPAIAVWSGTITGWTHVAVSIVNKQAFIYINGSLAVTGLTSSKTNLYPSLGECGQYGPLVGGIGGGSYGYYAGEIDEFRLWGSVRTSTQIVADMYTELSCPGPYAYYKFNQGTAGISNPGFTTAPDYSGNNFTATLTGFALTSTVSNWSAPGAVSVGVSPASPTITANLVPCSGQTVALGLSGSITGTWSPGSAVGNTIVVSPSVATIYTTVVNTSSCTYISTFALVPNPLPVLNVMATSSINCPGITTTLSASGAISYTWLPGNTNASTMTLAPNSNTIITLTGTGLNNCNNSTNYTLAVYPLPSITATSPSNSVCQGSLALLSASGASTYIWQPGNYNGQTYSIYPIVNSVYTVTGSSINNCTNSATFSMSILNNPTLQISPLSPTVCLGNSMILTASGASTYTWVIPGTQGSSLSVSPTVVSTYTVIGTSSLGCQSGANRAVQMFPIPSLSFNTYSITCASLGIATIFPSGGVGPFSYSWMPTAQTSTVANNLNPGTYTLTTFDAGTGCTSTATTVFTSLIPLSGNLSNSGSITCNGVGTGTAVFTNMAGGSPSQNYFWTNGINTSSSAAPTNLMAGNWSVTVTDALTACQIFSVFTITQPPAMTLNIGANTTTACVGTSIVLTGTNSGGTPGYSYTWTAGPPTNTLSVAHATGGTYVYTLSSNDAFNCFKNNTISIGFVNNPVLTVSDVSICPLETGTLSVSGASSYTWNGSSLGSTFAASPFSSTQYAVVGTALACTTAATPSIIVKPIPSPTIASNSPICNGQTLLLSASGGTSYLWTGPLSFSSTIQNPTISAAAPNTSGMYNLTVTAANSCTAPASTNVQVNPTPTISLSGGPVCLNSDLYLSANSFTGAGYFWIGPNSFTSSLQNPTIIAASFSAAGTYSLLVTSVSSCTNTSTLAVTVNPLPTVGISPTSTVICYGKSNTLTATGGITYLWNTGSSATVIVVSPTVNTSYTVLGTSALSCTNSAVRNISVNVLPSVSVVVNPTVYCAGRSSTLSASGANTYTWSTNATSNNIVVNPIFTSFYNVRGTSAVTGCSNTAFVTVSVNPLPNIVASTTKSIICTGTSATINASGANTYTWMPGNSVASMITPSPMVNTTYTVRGTIAASGCTNMAVRTISVNITPTVLMVSNTPSICIGWSLIITPSGASTYTLNPGNLMGTSFTVSPPSTTQFSLIGTNSVNCVNLLPSTINTIVHNLKAIQGVVTSTTGQNNGNVVLYAYKPVLGKWDSLNTSLVILNNYNFPSVPSGSYVVKSFPFPTDLVETYGLSASSWKGASVINHNCLVNSNQNINIITFNNLIKSKATLSGKITQGAGYANPGSPGAPIPNITVKAGIYPGPRIYQTTKTNSAGQYTLVNVTPNLSGENYYILVDIPALDTNKTYHRIIITGFENFTNLDFVVDSQRIHPLNLKVGVKELSMLNTKIKVYPNPTSGQISIELELNKTEMVSLELYDISARKIKVLLDESLQDSGKLLVLAKVDDLKEGIYLLKIKIGNEENVMKLNVVK